MLESSPLFFLYSRLLYLESTYSRRDVEEGLTEGAVTILKSNNGSRCFVATLVDKDGMRSRHYALIGYS